MIDKTPRSATWTFIEELLRLEAAGGILLVVAALVATVWANSVWGASYRDLLDVQWACQFDLRCDLKAVLLALDWIGERAALGCTGRVRGGF